jgi:nucleoside-diphosphate-sugar epimerase
MSLSGKIILVTGATGFLGGALAQRLAREGVYVRAMARRPEKGHILESIPNIEPVQGNINDAARMVKVTQGCDYVFHVAAALGGTLAKQRAGNVDGTRKVMLAAAAAQVQRFVHVSSIAVYGYSFRTDVTEDMPLMPGRVPYNVTKAEAENVVRDIGEQHHLPYAIIRPGMIYGPRSNTWTKTLFQLGKRKPTPFPGDGNGSVFPIFIDDVVDMMIVLAEHPAAVGEVFNCAPDPAPSWREFIGGYSRLAGHNRWLGIPVLPLKIIAPLAEIVLTLQGEPQDLPLIIPFMQSKITYKMTKAHDLLNWQPSVTLQDGIDCCAPWLREKGLLNSHPS